MTAVCFLLAAGCGPAPEEMAERGRLLKEAADAFVRNVAQGRWEEAARLARGEVADAERLRQSLTSTWVPGSEVSGGTIHTLSWMGPRAAKVKVNWSFQDGMVQSFSAETFLFVYEGGSWKYAGRLLR